MPPEADGAAPLRATAPLRPPPPLAEAPPAAATAPLPATAEPSPLAPVAAPGTAPSETITTEALPAAESAAAQPAPVDAAPVERQVAEAGPPAALPAVEAAAAGPAEPAEATEAAAAPEHAPPPLKPSGRVALPEPRLAPAVAPTAAAAEKTVEAETAAIGQQVAALPDPAGPAAPQGDATAVPAGAGAGGSVPTPSVGAGGPEQEAYLAAVMQWLESHKRYPKSAERRRQQGRALVAFTVTANGQVSGIRLVGGSGYGVLDEEALALLQRASPLPPFPPELGAASLLLELPVDFSLR